MTKSIRLTEEEVSATQMALLVELDAYRDLFTKAKRGKSKKAVVYKESVEFYTQLIKKFV